MLYIITGIKNAAARDLLVMIREFDERAGFLKWGLDNCAEWLAWRCDLSMTTAREKVRVAHALKHLPLISSAFSTGELSYTVEQSALAGNEGRAALPIVPGTTTVARSLAATIDVS